MISEPVLNAPVIPPMMNDQAAQPIIAADVNATNDSLNLQWLRQAPDIVREMYYNPDPTEEKYIQPLKKINRHPDAHKSALKLIEQMGFETEVHTVKTADSYELQMQRINIGGKDFKELHQTPVLIQHGLFSDSDSWLLNKEHSLPFKLAMAGYDVWLGNNRGSQYGRKNENLDADKDGQAFFDFSFYEMGKYDVPAQIDYIRDLRKVDKISYIGHSQGTTQMFSALSMNHGDLQDKVNVFISLAPLVKLGHAQSGFFKEVSKDWWNIYDVSKYFHLFELSENEENYTTNDFCGYFGWFCNSLNKYLGSKLTANNDKEACKIEGTRKGQSASLKSIIHYAQNYRDGQFKQFNYGSEDANTKAYGSAVAPKLPLSSIKVPVAMLLGRDDQLSVEGDSKGVYDQIPSAFFYKVYANYDHYTWQMGKDSNYVFDVITLLKKFNQLGTEENVVPIAHHMANEELNIKNMGLF